MGVALKWRLSPIVLCKSTSKPPRTTQKFLLWSTSEILAYHAQRKVLHTGENRCLYVRICQRIFPDNFDGPHPRATQSLPTILHLESLANMISLQIECNSVHVAKSSGRAWRYSVRCESCRLSGTPLLWTVPCTYQFFCIDRARSCQLLPSKAPAIDNVNSGWGESGAQHGARQGKVKNLEDLTERNMVRIAFSIGKLHKVGRLKWPWRM